jgi:hypothetical protein
MWVGSADLQACTGICNDFWLSKARMIFLMCIVNHIKEFVEI